MKRIASSFAALPATARGAIWMCFACASFATMALTIRLLSTDIPPLEIGFFRAFFSFLLMVPYAIRTGPSIWKSKNHKAFMARGVTGAGFVMFFFPGVALMEIADAQALTFTTPLFGMMLAMLFLGERFRVNRVLALAVGFAGALIIIRPGFQEISLGAILVLCSALSASGSGTLMKYATRSDAPDKVVFFHAIYMTPIIFIGALFDWQWPNLWELFVLIVIAALATLNQRFLGRAFAATDATAVFPFIFMRLPFGAALGFAVFQEIPDLWVWLGGAVIFGAALYLARSDTGGGKPAL
ncbi:MAG: EamA family transporter [Alphaproteobacteria bacterium]|nr:EamA family transporter [Alphaproteobacteria bacterium]